MEIADKLYEKLKDPLWRLDNIYLVKNQELSTDPVPLKLREEQRFYLENEHTKNYIAKSRQLGLSTIIVLKWLDECLFNKNTTVATIDYREVDCGKKLEIASFAYHNGPKHPDPAIAEIWKGIHKRVQLERENQSELKFSNGSKYMASMSFTGQSLKRLHVSELSVIADDDVSRAYKIIQGSFPAVGATGIITVETTMRSGSGPSYALFKSALDCVGKPLNALSFKFFFFPWYNKKEYSIKPIDDKYSFDMHTIQYFDDLEKKYNIVLNDDQKFWYQEMAKIQKRFMRREFPSVASECVMVSSENQIYPEITQLRIKGRVKPIEIDKSYPVYVSADLGYSDFTAMFVLQWSHRDILLHRAYMKSGHGASATADQIRKWESELGIHFAKILLPHDGVRTGTGSGTSYVTELRKAGISENRIIVVPRTDDVWTGINCIRDNINRFYIDVSVDKKNQDSVGNELPSCLECLELYKTNPNIPDKPYHDKIGISDVCDALRTFFEAYEKRLISEKDFGTYKNQMRNRPTTQKSEFVGF